MVLTGSEPDTVLSTGTGHALTHPLYSSITNLNFSRSREIARDLSRSQHLLFNHFSRTHLFFKQAKREPGLICGWIQQSEKVSDGQMRWMNPRDAGSIQIPHSWFRFSKAGLEKVCKKAGMFGSLKIWWREKLALSRCLHLSYSTLLAKTLAIIISSEWT